MNQSTDESMLFAEVNDQLNKASLSGEQLQSAFSLYSDIIFPSLPELEYPDKLTALYCEGMIDKTELNQYFSRVCQYINQTLRQPNLVSKPPDDLPLFEVQTTMQEMVSSLFTGNLIIYREGATDFWVIHISRIPQRALQESNTEISIKGPRDAFTEDLYTNISLIRKRMNTGFLYSKQFMIGSLSKTEVSLLYLANKVSPEMITEVSKRLNSIDMESLISSGQLEQYLSDRTFSLFPLIDYIGRPDYVVETLLRGRFIIIVEGSPMVLIGPSNFFELLKSPEDIHFPYFFVMLQRALRITGLMLSIFLPGFWISISSVNIDQIPYTLLSTIVISREGVPLPSVLEAMLLLFQFELLREAGVRLPKAVGQTIGIVGGLIIGDSLIRAGLASPTILVVIAVSVIATFSLVNQSLSGTVSLLRAIILIVSSYLGIYGFFLCMFFLLIYLCRLTSFGMAYLEPIVSLRFRDWLAALLLNPFQRSRNSSAMIKKEKGSSN